MWAPTYDYSGYTGTFTIPDETAVTIIYTTRVSGAAGEKVSFTNTASLGRTTDEGFAGTATTVNEENITITPTGSDIEGEGGVYTIRLFVYAKDHLEQGLGGAVFRLLDYNQQPLRYGKDCEGHSAGDEVTFTTASLRNATGDPDDATDVPDNVTDDPDDVGYVQIRLTEEEHGLSPFTRTLSIIWK